MLTQMEEIASECVGTKDFKVWRTAAMMSIAISAFLKISEAHNLQQRDIMIGHDRIKFYIKVVKRRPDGFSTVISTNNGPAKLFAKYLIMFRFDSWEQKAYVFPPA